MDNDKEGYVTADLCEIFSCVEHIKKMLNTDKITDGEAIDYIRNITEKIENSALSAWKSIHLDE